MNSSRDRFVAFAFCWADALIELDPARQILFAAGATRALVGAKPESLVGRNFNDLVDPKDRVLVTQLLAMATKHARIHNVEIHLMGADGKRQAVSFAGYVLPD